MYEEFYTKKKPNNLVPTKTWLFKNNQNYKNHNAFSVSRNLYSKRQFPIRKGLE